LALTDPGLIEIPARVAPRVEGGADKRIPRILHQTFETTSLAPRMHAAAMTWIEANPGFEYRFSTNEDRAAFIAAHFGEEVSRAYSRLDYGAFRADLWRYCALFVEGGVYADLDTVCRGPLEAVLRPEDEFVISRAGSLHFAAFNAFIASRPGHPFLQRAVERATATILSGVEFDGYMTTGPGGLGRAMNLVLGRAERAELTAGPADSVPWRLIEKRVVDGRRVVTDGDAVILQTKYEGYLDDLDEMKVPHWEDSKAPRTGDGVPLKRRLKRRLKALLGR
jgi:hypothetical protein